MTARTTPAGTAPARGGDVAALFAALYAENFDRVLGVVIRRVADRALAEDLTQDLFVKVWADAAAGVLDLAGIEAPFAWLVPRAKWTVGRHWGAVRARAELLTGDETLTRLAGTESPIDLVTARVSVGQLVFGLPFELRRALALHLWEDLPVDAVAEATGQTAHTVRAQVAQGLTALRVRLGLQPDLVAAAVAADDARTRARRLRAMAGAGRSRPVHVRRELRAAIAAGTYRPGDALPGTRVLADRHAPAPAGRLSDPLTPVRRALDTLVRQGLLTRTNDGFTVTADAPELAATGDREPSPARRELAGELLAGTWPVGAALPARRVLADRYGCGMHAVDAALEELVDLGVLTRPSPSRPPVVADLPGHDGSGQGDQGDPAAVPAPVGRAVVREHLAQELAAGVYPPGTRLVQTDLAARLGCHHITVGKALAELAGTGAVTRIPVGYIAATPTTPPTPPQPVTLRDRFR